MEFVDKIKERERKRERKGNYVIIADTRVI